MSFASAHALMARVPLRWRALATILILAGLLGAMVESRARILRSGTEVRLRTVPVDPRDLFRGDYVILNYQISTIAAAMLPAGEIFRRGDAVFVTLAPYGNGFARVAGVARRYPVVTAPQVVLAGRVENRSACGFDEAGAVDCSSGRTNLRVSYGIESYFIPEGTGRPIETTDRERLEIVVAVSASGEAAIKRLLIDGKLVHAEPPY